MTYTKKEIIRNMILVFLGCAIASAGFVLFMEPSGINCGGISGVAMLIKQVIDHPALTMGVLVYIINIPLFIVGYKKIGKYFFYTSLVGMFVSGFGFDTWGLVLPALEVEPLVAVIFGATSMGVGFGIVFLAGASTGGVDIIARLLKLKFRNCPIGKLILCFDMLTAIATGFVYHDFNNTLYSVIALFIVSAVVDYVVYSVDYAKVAIIITARHEEVADMISKKLDRGVTYLNGQGYYSGQDKKVILSAVKRKQLAELKELVNGIDSEAFIILQDAQQVLGDGFKRYDRHEL